MAVLAVVFPSLCVIACFLIARHYFVLARTAANESASHAEDARLAAKDADTYADEAHAIATDLGSPSVDDRPTEVMERVVLPEQEPEHESVPLARTPAQRLRAAGADSGGEHRLAPSPVPRKRGETTA